jgi:uncharacterized protein (DUF2249 family)
LLPELFQKRGGRSEQKCDQECCQISGPIKMFQMRVQNAFRLWRTLLSELRIGSEGRNSQRRRKMVELDLRPVMPFERHELIFKKWDSLKPGETLRITNDHNPKPLWYQFEAELKGKFDWTFEQEGPKDWIFKIKKL